MSEKKQVAEPSLLDAGPEEDERPSVVTEAPPPHLRLGFFTTACLVVNRMIGELVRFLGFLCPRFMGKTAFSLTRQHCVKVSVVMRY
jgi:hypothetical protein